MNESRKELLRNMPEFATKEDIRQLTAAKPDIWRWVRAVPMIVSLLIAYFIVWCTVAFFTDAITPWFITIMVAGWTAPKYLRRL